MINLAKLKALVLKATDPGDSVEEQRTTGVIACKLIRAGDFDFETSKPSQPSVGPRSVRMIVARFDSPCVFCDRPIRSGTVIYYQKYFGAWHPYCANAQGGPA